MNDKFDELAKGLAQSVTRRQALKKFGVGLAGVMGATLGLANKTAADPGGRTSGSFCTHDKQCASGVCLFTGYTRFHGRCQ